MLAKVIKLKNERGGRVSAHHGVQYIFREGGEEHALERDVAGSSFNFEMGNLDLADPLDRAPAIRMMDYTAEAGRLRNRFTSNPFYHYAISWREGERPTPEQCRDAAGHLFGAETDALAEDPFQVFEMEHPMNKGDRIVLPVLSYLFHRIEQRFKGQPTLLALDEAWIMRGHPAFKAKIREWLKVLFDFQINR